MDACFEVPPLHVIAFSQFSAFNAGCGFNRHALQANINVQRMLTDCRHSSRSVGGLPREGAWGCLLKSIAKYTHTVKDISPATEI